MFKYFVGLAALLCASPAVAQIVSYPTALPDSDGDGIIKLDSYAAKVAPPVKRYTVVVRCPELPGFQYAVQGTPCTVVAPPPPPESEPTPEPTPTPPPPPPPPPPVVEPDAPNMVFVSGELFLKDAAIVGISPLGSVGSLTNAPVGFTDGRSTYARKAYLPLSPGYELVGVGAGGHLFATAYTLNSVRFNYTNGALVNYNEIPGTLSANGVWTGEKGCLSFVQTPKLSGVKLSFKVVVKNVCNERIANVRYVPSVDVDDGTINYTTGTPTTNKVIATGIVQATLLGSSKPGRFILGSIDARAKASVFGCYGGCGNLTADNLGSAVQPIGYTLKADRNINLTFDLGSLEAGASTELTYYMDFAKA